MPTIWRRLSRSRKTTYAATAAIGANIELSTDATAMLSRAANATLGSEKMETVEESDANLAGLSRVSLGTRTPP